MNRSVVVLLAAGLLSGCGHREGDGREHDQGEIHGRETNHDHEHEESPSGASFKAGKGVLITEETKKILGLEVMDVAERKVPIQIRFTVQVFGEQHDNAWSPEDHSRCDVRGSGLVAPDTAGLVKSGQLVELFKETNNVLAGVVVKVQPAMALGESEIVIGVSNAVTRLKAGEFVPARIQLPRAQSVMAIPQAALLRTSEGTFVYAVNGDAYYRTVVKIGAEADGWVEIVDGLLAGDAVVTQPTETLWLIELRAVKGGGHSH